MLRRVRSELLLAASLETVLARTDRRLSLERAIQQNERRERALQAASRSRGDPPPPGGWKNFGTSYYNTIISKDKQTGLWVPDISFPFSDSGSATIAASSRPAVARQLSSSPSSYGVPEDSVLVYHCFAMAKALHQFEAASDGLGWVPWVDLRQVGRTAGSSPALVSKQLVQESIGLMVAIDTIKPVRGTQAALNEALSACSTTLTGLASRLDRHGGKARGNRLERSSRDMLAIAAFIARSSVGYDAQCSLNCSSAWSRALGEDRGSQAVTKLLAAGKPAVQAIRSASELPGGLNAIGMKSWIDRSLNRTKSHATRGAATDAQSGASPQLQCASPRSDDYKGSKTSQGGVCLDFISTTHGTTLTASIRREASTDSAELPYRSVAGSVRLAHDPMLGCAHLGLVHGTEDSQDEVTETIEIGQLASSRFAGASYRDGHGPRRRALGAGTTDIRLDQRGRSSPVPTSSSKGTARQGRAPGGALVPTHVIHGHRYGAALAPSLGSRHGSSLPGIAHHSVSKTRRKLASYLNATVARRQVDALRALQQRAGGTGGAVAAGQIPGDFLAPIAGDGRIEREDVDRVAAAVRGLLSCPVSVGDKYSAQLGPFLGIGEAGRSTNSKVAEVLRIPGALESMHSLECGETGSGGGSSMWSNWNLGGVQRRAGPERCDVHDSWHAVFELAAESISLRAMSEAGNSSRRTVGGPDRQRSDITLNSEPSVWEAAVFMMRQAWSALATWLSLATGGDLQGAALPTSTRSKADASYYSLLSTPTIRFAPGHASKAAGAGVMDRRRRTKGDSGGSRSNSVDTEALEQWPEGLPKPYEEEHERGRQRLKRGGFLGPVLNPKRPMDHFLGIDWEWAGFRATQVIGFVTVVPVRLAADAALVGLNAVVHAADAIGFLVVDAIGLAPAERSCAPAAGQAGLVQFPACLTRGVIHPTVEGIGGTGSVEWIESQVEWLDRRLVRLFRQAGMYRFVSRLWFVYDAMVEAAFPPSDTNYHRAEVLALLQTGTALTSMAAAARDRAHVAATEAVSLVLGSRPVDHDTASLLLQQSGRMQLIGREAALDIHCTATWSGDDPASSSLAACLAALSSSDYDGRSNAGFRHRAWEAEQVTAIVDARVGMTSNSAAGAVYLRLRPSAWWQLYPPLSVTEVSFPPSHMQMQGRATSSHAAVGLVAASRCVGDLKWSGECPWKHLHDVQPRQLGLYPSRLGLMAEPRAGGSSLWLLAHGEARDAAPDDPSTADSMRTMHALLLPDSKQVSRCKAQGSATAIQGPGGSTPCVVQSDELARLLQNAKEALAQWLDPAMAGTGGTSTSRREASEASTSAQEREQLLRRAQAEQAPVTGQNNSRSHQSGTTTQSARTRWQHEHAVPAWLRVLLLGSDGVRRSELPLDVEAVLALLPASRGGDTGDASMKNQRPSSGGGRWVRAENGIVVGGGSRGRGYTGGASDGTGAGTGTMRLHILVGELCDRMAGVMGAVSWEAAAPAVSDTRGGYGARVDTWVIALAQGPGAC